MEKRSPAWPPSALPSRTMPSIQGYTEAFLGAQHVECYSQANHTGRRRASDVVESPRHIAPPNPRQNELATLEPKTRERIERKVRLAERAGGFHPPIPWERAAGDAIQSIIEQLRRDSWRPRGRVFASRPSNARPGGKDRASNYIVDVKRTVKARFNMPNLTSVTLAFLQGTPTTSSC